MTKEFVLENEYVTEEVMLQYEALRQIGVCNMLDTNCVFAKADEFEYYDLGSLEIDDYLYILKNFNALMKYYDIKQDDKAVSRANATAG